MNTARFFSRFSAPLIIALTLATGLAGVTLAQTPQQFNYQGRITDATGQPFATGSYCFAFGLWTDADGGGTKVWGDEVVQDVYVVDGYFNVILGAGLPLGGKFHEAERYLGIKVGADCAGLGGEILPRQKVLSSPYALTSSDLVGKITTRDYFGYARLEGLNSSDQLAFQLSGSSVGQFSLFQGGSLAQNHTASSSGGYSYWYGGNGSINAYVGYTGSDSGLLRLYNSASQARLYTGVASNGSAYLNAYGSNGQLNTQLTYTGTPDHGAVLVRGTSSSNYGMLYVDPSRNAGSVWLTGANGNGNVYLGTLSGYNNNGGIAVSDSAGNEQAGIAVLSNGRGRVWGDEKNFVVEHPTRAGHRIVYTSQEGPEASIFVTGRATLVEGKATIQVPEHFAALAALETVTVHLTPHSLTSKGLAVASIERDTIVVGELFQGQGDYEVSYEIQAVRADKLGREAVISDAEFRATFGVGGNNTPDVPLPETDADGIVDIEQRP